MILFALAVWSTGAAEAAAQRAPEPEHERLDEMERLAQLHDRGALTDEEFAAEKSQLLTGA